MDTASTGHTRAMALRARGSHAGVLGLLVAMCFAKIVGGAAGDGGGGAGDHDAAMASMEQGLLGGDGIAGKLVDKLKEEGGDHTSVWTVAGSEADAKGGSVGGGGLGGGLFGFNPSGFTVEQASSGELLNQLKLEAQAREQKQVRAETSHNAREIARDLAMPSSFATRTYKEKGPSSAWPRAHAQQQLLQHASGWVRRLAARASARGRCRPSSPMSPRCTHHHHI